MAKHRRADRDSQSFCWPAFAAVDQRATGLTSNHRDRTGGKGRFRRKRRDDLFERSFRMCLHCGEHVYVLASSCRNCQSDLGLAVAGR